MISGIGVGWIRIDRYSLMHGIIVLLFNTQVLLLVKMQAVARLTETPPRIYTSPVTARPSFLLRAQRVNL